MKRLWRRQSAYISLKSRKNRSGHKAAESICVSIVEGPGAPEEVADVHQEAVEVVDVSLRVFMFASWWRFRHSAFEGALVCCEDGAESGEVTDARVKENEEVDGRG